MHGLLTSPGPQFLYCSHACRQMQAVSSSSCADSTRCGCHQYGVPLRWCYESRRGSAVRASRL
eukprot:4775828-Pleurochrysis_carterae.AAC.1